MKKLKEGVQTITSQLNIIGELVGFFWERRLWWLIPMVLALTLFGMVMFLAQSSAVAPFIYTLF